MNVKPCLGPVNPEYVDNPFIRYVDACERESSYRIVGDKVEFTKGSLAPDHIVIDITSLSRLDMYYSVATIIKNKDEAKNAFDTQISGNHYSKLKIQPMEYALANNLNYGQANAIKYITRYADKNGKQDLEKAIHCIQLLMDYKYPEEK
jgi:Protein of unknwon function (DUF3310)